MKKLSSFFWGTLLIAAGGFSLAQNLGYLTDLPPVVWIAVFAGISVLSLVFYFMSGIQYWGMLFPVGIFGALAFLLIMEVSGVENPAMAAPLFVGIGLPFVVAYTLDRARNWWALIPAGVMAFLTFVMLVVENQRSEVVGSALFFILAATFGLVFATRRASWAALVAYILFALGFMPLLSVSSRPEMAGIYTMFAIALPFFWVYLQNSERHWWAIIPAGITATTGLLVALTLFTGSTLDQTGRLANVIMYLGVALTFLFVGLRHQKRWGLWFAVLAAGMAAFSGLTNGMQSFWPLLLVLAGGVLLFNAIRPAAA